MLQDFVRTGAYHTAVVNNPSDFFGKVVLDVGAGSGILSLFCAQNGAKKVYAVEASDMAKLAIKLVHANGLEHVISVILGKIEEVELPEKVDVIISEPIGVFLLHERMIESFIYAREKFLKPQKDVSAIDNLVDAATTNIPSSVCTMYPSRGFILMAPFTDSNLYTEIITKARFWEQTSFYGVNLTGLEKEAFQHYFSQPIVGSFDAKTLMAPECSFDIDFQTVQVEDLYDLSIPFSFQTNFTGICHGLAGWFDLSFEGTNLYSSLSTSPSHQRTHWYQIRFLFAHPVALNVGQILQGKLLLKVNEHRSYDISIDLNIKDTLVSHVFAFKLQDQQYSFLQPTTISENEFKPEMASLYP